MEYLRETADRWEGKRKSTQVGVDNLEKASCLYIGSCPGRGLILLIILATT